MEAEEAAPLFQRIITRTKFEDNCDEITFAAPVCLTGIAVGAMPGATPDGGHAFLNVFARDCRACGAARFACLYEGLQQPTAGVNAVHIQPFVTDHVVLRGRYQTAPITLLGMPLAEAASQYVPRPETPRIDIDQALPRFQGVVQSLPGEEEHQYREEEKEERNEENAENENSIDTPIQISFSKDAWPALKPLLKFWRSVGSSYRKISESTVPAAAFTAAVKAADAICEKLAKSGGKGSNSICVSNDVADLGNDASIDDAELIDMAMGWCGFLAHIPIPLAATSQISECTTAGIAAMVLLSTRTSAATALLARHGQVLLATALKSPSAPGLQLRHATAACLLLALTNGAAGCEALLGWWNPSFIQWAAPAKKHHSVEEREKKTHHREDRAQKMRSAETGKGEKRKEAERETKPSTTTTTAAGGGGVKNKKEDTSKDVEKKKQERKEKVEAVVEEGGSTQRRRRGGAPLPSNFIPQVDGAGDEKRRNYNNNNNNKRQKRDVSNNRDQQQRGGNRGPRNNGNTGGNRRQNRGDYHDRGNERSGGGAGGGGGNDRHRRGQFVEANIDDDRWDGGGAADYDAEMWQPEVFEEEKEEYSRRGARDDDGGGGGDEERRGRERGREEEKTREYHRRRGQIGSKDRNRQQSRDRSKREDRDKERDETHRSSRDGRQQKEREHVRPSRDRSEEKKGRKEQEEKEESLRGSRDRKAAPEKSSKGVVEKQQQGRGGGERGRKDELPEKKLDLRQQLRERERAPPPPPPPRAPPSSAASGGAAAGMTSHPPNIGSKSSKEGKKEQEDVAILHKFTYFWDDRLRHYVGVYSSLATALLQIQPRTLTSLGTRLMRLLRFYEHVTMFSNYAEELTGQYLPSKRSSMPSQEAVALAAKCGSALANMAEYLALGDFISPIDRKKSDILDKEDYSSVKYKNKGIHPLFLEILESRRVLSFLPALILAPATHKARCEEDGGDAATTASASSAAMSNQLALGLRPFLSALTSNVSGLKALAAAPGVVSELLRVLRLPGVLDNSLSSAVAPLGHLVVALVAVEDLSTCSFTSPKFASAAATLCQLLSSGSSQRIPAVHAVCLSAHKALFKLVDAVIQRCDVMLEAAGMIPLKNRGEEEETNDDGDAFGRILDSLPSLEICTDILLALLKECTSVNVAFTLAPAAAAMLPALSVAAENLCGCPAPGAATLYTSVESICGGLEALSALHTSMSNKKDKSIVEELVAALTSDLPPLAPVTFENFLSSSSASTNIDIDEENNGGSSNMYVDWADIREFWDNPRKKYRAEIELKLLTMLLWEPTGGDGSTTNVISTGRTAAAEMQYNDGQRIVLRALLTAGEAAAASHADRQWVSRTGAAIDPATAASNKHASLEFLSTSAATASAFFQHMRDIMPVKSTACAAALLEAHALVSSEEECLLALMGQSGAAACGTAALIARHHLTSALRCWLECSALISSSSSASESSPWTPGLLPLILFGTKHAQRVKQHAVPALPPRQLFSAACVLGDLSPAEWPPAGTRRQFNPPPSHRAYRVAFAKAIDQNISPFKALISACVEAEPTLLRAAAARMLARAAGFGRDMGAFVIGPIVAALEAGAASQTPAQDVRKVLELLVPLVYRPALKAALLDTTAPAILAQILRVMVTGIPLGSTTNPVTIDPSDASAICTMAVECLVVLCNPEHMLDPQAPPEIAAIEDVPSSGQSEKVASILLEILSSLGVNVPLAHRVLRLLAGNVPGRAALRRAAAALHARSTGAVDPANPNMPQIVAAAQWVATTYWDMSQAQQAQHDAESSSSSSSPIAKTYADVSDIMKEICVAMEADGMVAVPPQAQTASLRFIAASKSAMAAAVAAGVDLNASEYRWEKGIPDPITGNILESTGGGAQTSVFTSSGDLAAASGVFDPVTRMFWKNYRARAVQQTPASASMVLRKYTRRACLPDEHFTVADTLHLPLTRPLRPLQEDMEAGQEVDGQGGGGIGGDNNAVPMEEGGVPHEGQKEAEGEIKKEGVIMPAEPMKVEKEEELPQIIPVAAPILPPSAVPVIAPSSVPAADFDLYADLGADLGIGGGTVAAAAPVAVAAVETAAPIAEPARVEVENHPKIEETVKEDKEKEETVSIGISPKAATELETSPKAASVSAADDPAALLNDPAAIAALLKDPVRMQELLQRNPALLVALKSKLGKQ